MFIKCDVKKIVLIRGLTRAGELLGRCRHRRCHLEGQVDVPSRESYLDHTNLGLQMRDVWSLKPQLW